MDNEWNAWLKSAERELNAQRSAAKSAHPLGLPALELYDCYTRSSALLDWFFDIKQVTGNKETNTQHQHRAQHSRAFWGEVSKWWFMMDQIDNSKMQRAFMLSADQYDYQILNRECRRALERIRIGRSITIYRGQREGDEIGLSWALSRDTAERAARAAIPWATRIENPVMLVAKVEKRHLALAFDSGDTVVPFLAPTVSETIRLY